MLGITRDLKDYYVRRKFNRKYSGVEISTDSRGWIPYFGLPEETQAIVSRIVFSGNGRRQTMFRELERMCNTRIYAVAASSKEGNITIENGAHKVQDKSRYKRF